VEGISLGCLLPIKASEVGIVFLHYSMIISMLSKDVPIYKGIQKNPKPLYLPYTLSS
jgi:hypothetical protein